MKNSLKQLLRRPGKAILLFFLMTAASMLLVLGVSMYIQNAMRQEKLDDLFVTTGTVEQVGMRDEENETVISPEVLNFPGAEYVVPPEHRPIYLAELPDSFIYKEPQIYDLMEFRVLEIAEEKGVARVKITNLLLNGEAKSDELYYGHSRSDWNCDEDQYISLEGTGADLQVGKTYIGYSCFYSRYYNFLTDEGDERVVFDVRSGEIKTLSHEQCAGMALMAAPFSNQHDKNGNLIESAEFSKSDVLMEEVTEGFWEEGGKGEAWLAFQKQEELAPYLAPVLGVTKSQLLPSFRQNNLQVGQGRIITDEEFRSGARVCMVAQTVMRKNLWKIGDKIRLPLRCSLYGCPAPFSNFSIDSATVSYFVPQTVLKDDFSLLNAQGELYEPFWDEEYEIVGEYSLRYFQNDLSFESLILIPRNSVQASDENNIAYYGPMTRMMTSFQLPNGAIEEFDAALREAVPEAEYLKIEYDDMGYSDVKSNLESINRTALLLLVIGIVASLTVSVLLIYFFVVREKKRTAIERSLGMTKRQCRNSLLSGLLVLTVIAVALGSCAAGILLDRAANYQQLENASREVEMADGDILYLPTEKMDLGGMYHFSARYSPWAMWDAKGNQAKLDVITPPLMVYVLSPLFLLLFMAALSIILINRSLRTDLILILSSKEE